jgi:hypothetical protein
MKCLSLHQPWATLILAGAIRYQSRPFGTRYRGRLAIHATKSFSEAAFRLCQVEPIRRVLKEAGYRFAADLPRGCLLGTVQLVDGLPAGRVPDDLTVVERILRQAHSGRYVWQLADPRLFDTPRASVGRLGLYELPEKSVVSGKEPADHLLWTTDQGPKTTRNRIKHHVRIRAGDLVPHEWNFRLHPERQKAALAALYDEVGFARSLLAYELPDGRLKLIDGHLRRDLDPDMEVDVEVLDVSDEEARTLLLSIDPLAALAQTNAQVHAKLRQITASASGEVNALWEQTAKAAKEAKEFLEAKTAALQPAQFLVLVQCRDEQHQVDLLERFQSEGLTCKALLS